MAPRPRVLWVDDESSVNLMAERLLPSEGFDVTIATDYSTAIEAIARGGHEVCVLDQRLPGRPDLEVLRKLREMRDAIPVSSTLGTRVSRPRSKP